VTYNDISYTPGQLTTTDYNIYGNGWPWGSTWYYATEPQSCMGKAHVFECEHVEKCKCGAIQRVMPKVKASKKK
jgi:hypothetical protein